MTEAEVRKAAENFSRHIQSQPVSTEGPGSPYPWKHVDMLHGHEVERLFFAANPQFAAMQSAIKDVWRPSYAARRDIVASIEASSA